MLIVRCTFLLAAYFVIIMLRPAQAEPVTLWVKAFIPNSGPAAIVSVPNHADQTMLQGTPTTLIGCFLTDQRDFSLDPTSPARMTSSLSLDLSSDGINSVSPTHATGTTQEVDCNSGSIDGKCTGQADNSGMSFSNIQFDADQKIFSFTLDGQAANPCFTFVGMSVAPNIHYKVLFSANATNRTWGLTATLGVFPSFEAYLQVGSNSPITLFQAKAQEFNGGTSIFLSRQPDIEVTGTY